MTLIKSDWHIHTCHSCDSASMRMEDLFAESRQCGMVAFGVTDHLHSALQIADLEESRQAFSALPADPRAHFGVEVSCMSRWELDTISRGGHDDAIYGIRESGPAWAEPALALDKELIERLGIEFVVGGGHWPLYVPLERDAVIRDYHRQLLFLATHPLVDIVAHPWWWMGQWADGKGCYPDEPWLGDFGRIPKSMHDEFAAAAREHGAAVEINLSAMLLTKAYPEAFKQRYADYLASLQERGVILAIGSDCHLPHYTAIDWNEAERRIQAAGINIALLQNGPVPKSRR